MAAVETVVTGRVRETGSITSKELVEKSIQAAISGIELYNKPDFRYREESFAILMSNTWELLLKGKVLKDGGEDLDRITEFRKLKNPETGVTEKVPKLNRSGNGRAFRPSGSRV
ncbi:MAG TPA: DUF3644 domain-containing protein [Myxococcales bacterium]|nr:DUF3644 domain-containing protein [Myxococcales bacterium]